ncbi:MAG: ABC transporter permease [Desulfobacterales bacterium]|nr:ABC transporter permease [Desulfobacterales bacterium]
MKNILQIILKRTFFGLLSVWVISVLIFLAVEALPGDTATAILGQSATPETVAALRLELKLDLPMHQRYFDWLGGFVAGDLGNSLAGKRPISQFIGWRLENTLFLAAMAALFAVPLSLGLGIAQALYRNSWFDKSTSVVSLSAISFPEFFIAYILILFLAIKVEWFPPISAVMDSTPFWDRVYFSVLPCLTLTFVISAHIMRMTRAATINVLNSAYIEMAQLKGLKRARIITVHALPNALSPIINIIILNLAYLIVGVVIVEVIFVYPGIGQLMVDSVSKRDLPVIQACGMIFAATYIFLNMMADILSILCNPKLRISNRT